MEVHSLGARDDYVRRYMLKLPLYHVFQLRGPKMDILNENSNSLAVRALYFMHTILTPLKGGGVCSYV